MKNRNTRDKFRPDAPLGKVWVLNTDEMPGGSTNPGDVIISDPDTGDQVGVVPGDEADTGDNAIIVTDPNTQEVIKNAFKNVEYKIGTELGTVTYDSSSTVLLSGSYPEIVSNAQLCYIKVDNGTTVEYLFSGVNGVYIAYASGVVTVTGVTPFASGDSYEIGINAPKLATDYDLNADLNIRQNPEYANYTSPETISDTNLAVGDYRTVFTADSFKYFSIHLSSGDANTTFTVWMSNNTEADDTSDDDWVDVSSDILGAASFTNGQDIFFIDTPTKPYHIMIKRVVANATNTSDIHLIKY